MQCECVHASNIHPLKSSGENLEYWHQRLQWNQWCTLYDLPPDAHPIIPTCAYMLHLTLLLACINLIEWDVPHWAHNEISIQFNSNSCTERADVALESVFGESFT